MVCFARQGGQLLWLDNEMEYDYISSIATTDMFWVGKYYIHFTNFIVVHDFSLKLGYPKDACNYSKFEQRFSAIEEQL